MSPGLALTLALRLALADTDGGTPAVEVDEVAFGTLQLRNGNTLVVDGGAYLPETSLLATGRELAQLRAENSALKAAPAEPAPNVLLIVIAAIVGLGLGIGCGVAIKH